VPDECGDFLQIENCPNPCLNAYERCVRRAQWRFIATYLSASSECGTWISDLQQYYQNPQYSVAVPVNGNHQTVQGGYYNFDDIVIYIDDNAFDNPDCLFGNIASGNFVMDCNNCQAAYNNCCN